MIAVKESTPKICKKELQILWSDDFKPEHLEKFPDLHDKVWKLSSSPARQAVHRRAGGAQLSTPLTR